MSYQPVNTNTNPYASTSDGRNTQYYTPETEHLQLHDDLPAGAAAPRFMGHATDEANRASFASSLPTLRGGDDYNNSSYALNDVNKPGFYGVNYNDSDLNTSQANYPKDSYGGSPYLNEKSAYGAKRSRKKAIIIGSLVALAVIIGAVVAVYFAIIKPKQDNNGTTGNSSSGDGKSGNDNSSGNDSGNGGGTKNNILISGGDGSTVTMDDGSTFTYKNSHGGTWYYDPENPFHSGARPQAWTPALNETFKYGEDIIYGVNLGGWLLTEPFIVPGLYEKYVNSSSPAFDEWDLSERMAADTANGGLNQLEEHYKTFITEKDFADIAAAGLNFVRIPIGYWAIETRENEPFLAKVSWTYLLKAIEWARKYGLRVNLDLHALPGSQNGWNHSGRLGQINVLYGPMGIANAQRSLDYIRIIAEFISQPEYRDVVVMFGITNEPFGPTIGDDAIFRFSQEAYNVVRLASGTGEGNGPWVVFHDAFLGLSKWGGYMPNGDRLQLDIHRYLCFDGQSPDTYSERIQNGGQTCNAWGRDQNASMSNFGMTHVGEWSLGINDCGQWLNGVNLGARYDGTFNGGGNFPVTGDCMEYLNFDLWDDQWKADMKQYALQSMSALQNWFFWTWKIGDSIVTKKPTSPAWSYSLGLKEGWMPQDPREALGACPDEAPFTGPFQPWQTGGVGAGDIPQSFLDEFSWPPTTLKNVADLAAAPQYTQTGALVTLPGPTVTATGVTVGNGWNNPSDTALMWVPVQSCAYLDPWIGPTGSPPACAAGVARREAAPFAQPTPPPSPSR